jgi:hypothetical protein
MSLNIEKKEVENLAGEIAGLLGVNKMEAIRQALEEKKCRVIKTNRQTKLKNLLEQEIWPSISKEQWSGFWSTRGSLIP